ncbi:MAG: 50S ribosomal protein L37ae [Candidatus Aenigmarchaeota archaeon]|nr:50S ribosomal protein L37ae [Candidatus Aenigmarchaeota archaeon]MBI5398706.1 50S ribosomal protein L37ae [Candidatus Woesearchaeota archaeon]
MAKKVSFGSIKRFGTRYGASKKLKFAQVEVQHRGKHTCPYCNYVQAKRVAAGIWMCSKCNAKFAARAYSLEKTAELPREKVVQEMPQEPEESQQKEEDMVEELQQ